MKTIHINNNEGIPQIWVIENDAGHIYDIALSSDRSVVSHICKYDCWPTNGGLKTNKIIGTGSTGKYAKAGFCEIWLS